MNSVVRYVGLLEISRDTKNDRYKPGDQRTMRVFKKIQSDICYVVLHRLNVGLASGV